MTRIPFLPPQAWLQPKAVDNEATSRSGQYQPATAAAMLYR
ncbi:hypothetical protein [Rheinheimera muenzenbergensis]